ncbi:methionyl-tRNA formyltransferase [bacterium]|nr:methionyl-tRNA formyltransferase [bacterium]MBU1984894.1 methionyl-tRNA formyltransferase [bacterium]
MRVVFCGNPEFALPTLDALLSSAHAVVAVVASPDKPQGRGRKLLPLPTKQRAQAEGVPVFEPTRLKDESFLQSIRALRPDCLVVVAFRILPRELFAMPRLGSFNVHPSLLPRGRGPAPIPWTLIRGETETGVTIIRLSETIDGGDILAQERIPVRPDDDFGRLHDRLAGMGAHLLVRVLDDFQSGNPPPPIPQNDAEATTAPKLTASDFEINWHQTAQDIHHRIRAFSPQPGAVARSGEMRLKILAAEAVSSPSELAPGAILHRNTDEFVVGTGHGALRLKMVQPEGRRPMSVAEYLRGRPQLPVCFDS